MPIPRATPKQMGMIHGLAGRARMDEDMRRGFLKAQFGVVSCKELTAAQASQAINKLQEMSAGAPTAQGAIPGLDGATAKKLRALWIAAWNLGLIRDRTDRAMLAFLERQTGVSHTRFLREPDAARPAIEALKDWLSRDGKVAWPGKTAEICDVKRAVLEAQWRRLIALGNVKPFIAHDPLGELNDYACAVIHRNVDFDRFTPEEFDLVQQALGRRLRAVLARLAEDAAREQQGAI